MNNNIEKEQINIQETTMNFSISNILLNILFFSLVAAIIPAFLINDYRKTNPIKCLESSKVEKILSTLNPTSIVLANGEVRKTKRYEQIKLNQNYCVDYGYTHLEEKGSLQEKLQKASLFLARYD